MPELERLQINIDADASGAKKGAAEAKQAMQELGATTQRATGTVDKSMSAASRAVGKLRSALGLADKAGQGMAKGTSAQMENLTRVHEAQIAKAEALRNTIKRLNVELAAAQRKHAATGSAKAGKMVESLSEKLTTKDLQLSKMTQQIDATAQKIWDLEDAAQKAGDQMENIGKKATRGTGRTKTVFESIGRSLRSMLIITAVSRGVVNLLGWLGRVVAADAQVSASLAAVRQNLLTAFAPIYNAALPAIQTLVGWLVSATNAISNFILALTGMTGKQATNIANKIGGIGGAAGGSAKQVNELLASFDELNKLGSGGGSGGGGGGGSGGGGGGGVGGIGSDAVADSIETINGGGNTAAQILGTLGKATTAYAGSLAAVGLALKGAKFLGGKGWGLSTTLNAASVLTMGASTLASAAEVAGSAWKQKRDSELAGYLTGDYSAGRKIVEWIRHKTDIIGASALGALTFSSGSDAWEKMFSRENMDKAMEFVKNFGRKDLSGMSNEEVADSIERVANPLSWFWKHFGQGAEARAKAQVDSSAALIESTGVSISGAIDRAMAIIRQGNGGEASIFRGAGRGSFPGIGSLLTEYITVDEAEVNAKINRLQDIARAVRQGIENAESIINDTMRNKEMAKPVGSDMPLGMDSQTIAAWASGTVNEKADRNSAQDLANAVAGILQGTTVNVDGKKLGELAVKAINKNARTAGRVDYAY